MALDIFKELGLDDSTPIDVAIAKLERLNGAIEALATNARKSSDTYSNALNEITQSAEVLEKSLASLDATNKKDQQTIANQSKQVDELSSDYDKYTKALKLNEAELLALLAAQDKLKASNEKLKKDNEVQAGSLNDLRKQLTETVKAYQAMGTATDQTVKDSALSKIKDLSKAVNDTEKALKDAKKGADAAAGSYDALSAKVTASRKELKAMEGGIGNTSKEFKALQAQIKADADALRDFDKSMGDSRPNVGNYESALAGLDQTTGGVIGRVQQLGKAFLNLLANPVVAFVALLVAGFAAAKSAVTEFYTSTGEGEDQLEEQQGLWNTFFTSIKNGWSDAGKAITEFIGLNKENMQGIYAAILAFAGLDAALAKYLNSVEESNRLVKEKQDLEDQLYDITIRQSEIQLQKSKLLLESNDKLVYSDAERLQKKKDIAVLSETELQNNLKRAKVELDIATTEVALTKSLTKQQFDLLTIEQKRALFKSADLQKIADATAHLSDVEAQSYQERKKNEAQIVNLTLEIAKAKRDAANAEIDTARQVDLFLIADRKRTNDELLKQDHLVNDAQLLSMEERQSLIMDNGRAELEALKIQKAQELDVVKRAAEDRARASVPTDQVETAVAGDKGLANQIDLINKKYDELAAKNREVTTDLANENVFKVIARDAQIAQDQISTITDKDLIALNKNLKDKLISLKDYEKQRIEIQGAGARTVLRQQIENLEAQLTNTKLNASEDAAITKKIYDLKLALSNSETAETIKNEKEKEAARKQTAQAAQGLANEVFNFATNSIKLESEVRIAESENQLQDLKDKTDARLKIVGDDKQAQSAIEAEYAEQQKKINADIAAEKRKAAIQQKAVSTVQALVNTALGVTNALASAPPPYSFILAAITGALGALQIAAIQKQTIPAFAKGTDSSPEGFALVGEAGREIAIDKKTNKAKLYDTPTVTFLNKGTQVIPNDRTEEILKMADIESINNNHSIALEYVAEARRLEFKTQGIIAAVDAMKGEVVEAVKYSKDVNIWDEIGYRTYERTKAGKVISLNKRYQQNG